MNDAFKRPSTDLVLILHWPLDEDLSSAGPRVVIELQFIDGGTLTSMSVPSEQLLQAAAQKLVPYPLISPAGLVSIVSDGLPIPLPESQAIALDHLVANAISTDMLEDEPDAATMLAEFRSRLLKSLEYVDQAIALLAKD